MKPKVQPTVISLFSSGGIGDFGLKQAGFTTVATAELLPRRLEVQRLNSLAPEEGYLCGDLNNPELLNKVVDRADAHTSNTGEPVSLLLATPPCQGMSVANHKKGDELARNSLVVRSIEAVSRIEPLVFMFENVPAFLKTLCTGTDSQDRPIGEEIERILGSRYEYYSRTLPLHEHGSPSRRRRSITIGVRNDVLWTTPLDLFPKQQPATTLRELVGHLPSLTEPNQYDPEDIFHAFRPYEARMRRWVSATPEGASAFDNPNLNDRPHRIIDGKRVDNVRKNGDKYRRVYWDSIAPCVHTRNDILASQSTVHPQDDRVFSIRELMLMMGLPSSFKWISDLEIQAATTDEEIAKLLKTHAPNIRQCLGEGVPASILKIIGTNIINHVLSPLTMRGQVPKRRIDTEATTEIQKRSYVQIEDGRKRTHAAFYTQPLPAFALAKRAWEQFRGTKRPIHILEPSAGAGVFASVIAQLIEKETVHFTSIDIDPRAVEFAQTLRADFQEKFASYNCIQSNYLAFSAEKNFDLVIGNPPFGRGPKAEDPRWGNSFEIADQFFRKAIFDGSAVSFIFPKALLHAQGYQLLRQYILANSKIASIVDFGEVAFPDVKVETVGIHIKSQKNGYTVAIKSWPLEKSFTVEESYIADSAFPSWVIYRDESFDKVLEKSTPGRFNVWRDRALTKKKASEDGAHRVIRGKNISRDGQLVATEDDYFVSTEVALATIHKINSLAAPAMLLVPNLSYYPRAARFEIESNALPEGSCALLYGDATEKEIESLVEFAPTETFTRFYRTACNYATRSINVDPCLAFWWIVPQAVEQELTLINA